MSLFDTAPVDAAEQAMLDEALAWQPSQEDLDFLAEMVWEDLTSEG